MTASLTLESFAKVNRSLLVLGKREDGFHELDTLFSTIDLSDTLTFRPASETSLTCTDAGLSVGTDNLVIRAVRRLQDLWGISEGLSIHLEKRIPWGAGLGGGSSNAAVTLLAAARLFRPDVPLDVLRPVALELGSDVPFFLIGGRARGRGRGERLEPLEDTPDEPLVMVIPPFRLSTPEVFRTLRARPYAGTSGSEVLPDRNDLEKPAVELRPEMGAYLAELRRAGAIQARMSGSGSCLFGVFDSAAAAHEAESRLGRELPDCRVVSTRTLGRREYRDRAVP